MTPASKDRLLKPSADLGERIPEWLSQHARWTPWRATWNEGKGKWEKIPVRASHPQRGLSTARPEQWTTFEMALAAYLKDGATFSLGGIGFCLTDLRGIVAVDLDKCSDPEGNPEPWAASILGQAQMLGGYCERSPSGYGFRIFMQGNSRDWTNHIRGIEIYAGNAARFVTVTGHTFAEDLL